MMMMKFFGREEAVASVVGFFFFVFECTKSVFFVIGDLTKMR